LLTQHIKEQQANITSNPMHQHVCIIIFAKPYDKF
jgi:hypothetical protein